LDAGPGMGSRLRRQGWDISTSAQRGINSLFRVLDFVLAIAGIQRPVVRTKEIEKDDLPPPHSEGWWLQRLGLCYRLGGDNLSELSANYQPPADKTDTDNSPQGRNRDLWRARRMAGTANGGLAMIQRNEELRPLRRPSLPQSLPPAWFEVQGLGFRVSSQGFRVYGLGLRSSALRFRV